MLGSVDLRLVIKLPSEAMSKLDHACVDWLTGFG